MTAPATSGLFRSDLLAGKTIVVTGGGTGLGRAMATSFMALGAHVVITSRKADVLEQAASEMEKSTGGSVLPVTCDVRDYDQVERMWQTALDRYGSVNGLVNNAAGNFISPTERLSANAFSTVIDIVLKGTANCALAAGKYWIAGQLPGVILNIITTYAFTGSGYVVPSACAKGGVLTLTRSLAAEWGHHQIRTNAIAPGPFPTKGALEQLLPGDLAQAFSLENRVPLKRLGQHQELADLAAFLMSDFSGYINGEIITIDGGEWLQGAGQFNDLERLTKEQWDELSKRHH